MWVIGGVDCTIDWAVHTSNGLEVPVRAAHDVTSPDSGGSSDSGVEIAPLRCSHGEVILVGISGRGSGRGKRGDLGTSIECRSDHNTGRKIHGCKDPHDWPIIHVRAEDVDSLILGNIRHAGDFDLGADPHLVVGNSRLGRGGS